MITKFCQWLKSVDKMTCNFWCRQLFSEIIFALSVIIIAGSGEHVEPEILGYANSSRQALHGGEKEGRDGRYFNVEPYSWTGYNSFERAESEIYRLPYPGVWTPCIKDGQPCPNPMRPEFTCCSGVCGNHGRCNTACLKETWECHPEGTYPCCQTGLLCYGWTKSGYGHCRHGGITKTLDIGSYYLIYIVTSDHGRLCWYLDRGNQGNNYQFSFRLDPRCNPNDLSFMWKVLPGGYPNTVIFENNQFQSNCVSAVFYDVTCYGEEEPERDREVVCSTHVDPNRLGPFLGGCDNKGGVDTPYNSWTISGPKIFNRQTGRYITGTASRSLTMEQLGVGGGIQDWVYYKIPWVKEIGPVGYKPGLG